MKEACDIDINGAKTMLHVIVDGVMIGIYTWHTEEDIQKFKKMIIEMLNGTKKYNFIWFLIL